MAAKGTFISIDLSSIEALGARLATITADELGQAVLPVLNQVTSEAYDTARKRMNAGINLSDEYLQSHMTFKPATNPAKPEARVTAAGRDTILGHFEPIQLTKPAIHPARAKGDPKRGIPAGMKQGGVSVMVTRGNRKPVLGERAFTMTLKVGKEAGDKIGVFVRPSGGGKPRHLLAPSVYQLFRYALKDEAFVESIETALADRVTTALSGDLQKAITP